MPAWKNITLNIPKGDLNQISEKISEINRVLSITILDRTEEVDSRWFDENEAIQDLDGKTHLIRLLTSASVDSNIINKDICKKLDVDVIEVLNEEIFEDRDWIQYSKSQFREINITNNLTVLPPWVVDKNQNGVSIIIEPGSGFGTGSHPTTKLCLKWIDNNISSDCQILDYGCGSGILSIAAEKLGCSKVDGIDNDHQALVNAERNKTLNSSNVNFFHSDNYIQKDEYDITVANILLNTIVLLKEKLVSSLKPGGTLILSGILEDQASSIIDTFRNEMMIRIIDQKEGWLLMKGQK
jgi:ribosomal protein L11 methyltransferase